MKTSFSILFVGFLCLASSENVLARLGGQPIQARRLPHFYTFDDIYYDYGYDLSEVCDDGRKVVLMGEEGSEIQSEWNGEGCSGAGDVTLKRGIIKGELSEATLYESNDPDKDDVQRVIGGVVIGDDGSKTEVVIVQRMGENRNRELEENLRRLEDGLDVIIDVWTNAYLEFVKPKLLAIMTKAGRAGPPDYSFGAFAE